MPAKSAKQEKFMRAVAHSPSFAKKVGVPMSVGREFTKAGGGMAESKKMVAKEVAFMKKKGAPKTMIKHEESEMKGMKKGGTVGATKMGAVRTAAPSKDGLAVKGKTVGKQIKMAGSTKGMKRGGKC